MPVRSDGGGSQILANADAIPLASALVAHVARSLDIRILVIKGPLAQDLGLRPARPSADVDILVDPDRFTDLIDALRQWGWDERVHLWLSDFLDDHSVTVIHPEWPVDIDVHRFFPGFLSPAAETFDALWSRSVLRTLASQPVPTPDYVGSALIIALHALRWMHTDRMRSEYRFLVDKLLRDPAPVEEMLELAQITGSLETLAPLWSALGISSGRQLNAERPGLAQWNRRVAHPSRVGRWVNFLIGLRPRDRRIHIWRVIWPSRADFIQEHPELKDRGVATNVARLKRIVRGVRGLTVISLLAGYRAVTKAFKPH